MALFKFTKNILSNKPIKVFNFENEKRLTYIDDIICGLANLVDVLPAVKDTNRQKVKGDSLAPVAP